jgi:hypothetical protein
LPDQDIDLGQVLNPDRLDWLDPGCQAALEENGFVVVEGRAKQIYEAYQQAEENGWPLFVTTDALLHTHHVLYDYALRLAEIDYLIGDIEDLTLAMLYSSIAEYQASQGEKVRAAALRNTAYFAVAAELLELDMPGVPAEAEELIEGELALIESHTGVSESPVLSWPDLGEFHPSLVWEDYSQYVPRGHYTRNEDFERYFKAMMWYGRIGLRLRPGPEPDAIELGRRQTRQAILITAALYNAAIGGERALDVWARIYEPTVFFVGKADDLTIYDYGQAISGTYGETLETAALEDDEQLDGFIEAAMALRPPAIVSTYVSDLQIEPLGPSEVAEVTKGFRFMGQRFIPDSYIFQQLVYNEVKLFEGQGQPFTWKMTPAGPIRSFPRGLDVTAVLGSERALDILEAEGDTDYDGYDEQLAKLRQEFAGLPEEQWVENLYWNWLYSLRPLLLEKGPGYPAFMQTRAWIDKDIHTFLGSWAELRHDTILYAKQSYTIVAESARLQPEVLPGYVEPQPLVYARLAALTRQMIDGLSERGLLSDEYRQNLLDMERLLVDLKTISEKELRGEPLTEQEVWRIRGIGDALEGIVTLSVETADEITSETDERMAVVADVHTDLNPPPQVLEEGVGDASAIYVLVPSEDGAILTQGAVFSYYEFKQPLADRLTDEAWQAMDPKPERPSWTSSFEW